MPVVKQEMVSSDIFPLPPRRSSNMSSVLSALGRSLSSTPLPEGWSLHRHDDGLFLSHVVVDDFHTHRSACDRAIVLTSGADYVSGDVSFTASQIRVEASCQSSHSEARSRKESTYSCANHPVFMSAQLRLRSVEDVINLLSNPLCVPPCASSAADSPDEAGPRNRLVTRRLLFWDAGTDRKLRDKNGVADTIVSSSTNAASDEYVDEKRSFSDVGFADERMAATNGVVKEEWTGDENVGESTDSCSFSNSPWETEQSAPDWMVDDDGGGDDTVACLDPTTGRMMSDDTSERKLKTAPCHRPLLAKSTLGMTSQEMRDLISHKNQKVKTYSLDFKLGAVEMVEKGSSINAVSRAVGVDKRCVRSWYNNATKLRNIKTKMGDSLLSTRKRLGGGGAKRRFAKAEEELARFVWSEKSKGLAITRTKMLEKMNQLVVEAKLKGELDAETHFQGSSGWLARFLKRYNFSVRPTLTQKGMQELDDVVCAFLAYIFKLRREKLYPLGNIFNVDEVGVCFNSPAPFSFKQVEKGHINQPQKSPDLTVCLSASADGTRFKPLIIVKDGYPSLPGLRETFAETLVIATSHDGDVTPPVVAKLLTESLGRDDFADRCLLLWDSAPGHLQPLVLEEFTERRIAVVNIPGSRYSRYLQPADNGWKQSLKLIIPERFARWSRNEKRKECPSTYPPLNDVLDWVVEAWSSVSSRLIADSFKTTGISISLDGRDDERVGFLKPSKTRKKAGSFTPSFSPAKLAELRRIPDAERPSVVEQREIMGEDEKIVLLADDDVMKFH